MVAADKGVFTSVGRAEQFRAKRYCARKEREPQAHMPELSRKNKVFFNLQILCLSAVLSLTCPFECTKLSLTFQ